MQLTRLLHPKQHSQMGPSWAQLGPIWNAAWDIVNVHIFALLNFRDSIFRTEQLILFVLYLPKF